MPPNFNFGDLLSFMQGMNNMPISPTGSAGLGLAQTGQANQLQEFQQQLAQQEAARLWSQQFQQTQNQQQQTQQQFQNTFEEQQANQFRDPAFIAYQRLLNPAFAQQDTDFSNNFMSRINANSRIPLGGSAPGAPDNTGASFDPYSNAVISSVGLPTIASSRYLQPRQLVPSPAY